MKTYTTRQLALNVFCYTLNELAFKDFDDIAAEAEEKDYHQCSCCDKWTERAYFDDELELCDECRTSIEN